MADLKLEFGFGDARPDRVSRPTSTARWKCCAMRASSPAASPSTSAAPPRRCALEFAAASTTTDLQVFSQEVRLASTGEGAVPVAGGRVLPARRSRVRRRRCRRRAMTRSCRRAEHGVQRAARHAFFSRLSYDFKQFAAFGEATYRFNPQWALTGGLRYYDFEEDRLSRSPARSPTGRTSTSSGSTSSDGVSPRVILAYSPSKEVQFTAQVARGFRLGGINDPLNARCASRQRSRDLRRHIRPGTTRRSRTTRSAPRRAPPKAA